jgi:cell fate regulator YaaT (PSP1 superfamily)
MSQVEVVSVQFTKVGKPYWYLTNDLPIKADEFVVIETLRGLEMAMVQGDPKLIEPAKADGELKPVLRIATDKDIATYMKLRERAKADFSVAKIEAFRLGLPMKIVGTVWLLDSSKLTVTYTADERVDFRELVSKLSKLLHTRIEMRQMGERDAAKQIGGIGSCGRELCCSTFLTTFDAVSIKMAKNQNLSLNPEKITGPCGKLKCCISFEDDMYTDMKKGLPKKGDRITSCGCGGGGGGCKVIDVNVLKEAFTIETEEGRRTVTKEEYLAGQ